MSKTFKNDMRELMLLSWTMVREQGFTMSEAMKKAWMNYKLRVAMKTRIVQFFFIKASTGELRQAFGTTDTSRYSYEARGGRNGNYAHCVQYWDCEKNGFRMYKDYNLVRVAL